MGTETDRNQETFLEMRDGTRLFYRKDFPDDMKAAIVFVHGVGEHCGRYRHLAQSLTDAGYGVLRFDLRGHGQSGGERGYIASFREFAQDTHEFVLKTREDAPGVPVFMLGHSMGAFISAVYAILYPDGLDGQALSGLSATVLPLTIIKMLKLLPYETFPRIRLGNDLGKVVSRDPAVVRDYQEDPLNLPKATIKMASQMFLKGPEWLSLHVKEYKTPCLLLHGGGDLIVTPSSSLWFFDNILSVDKQRIVYPELYHEIFNEKERGPVIADVVSWLDKRTV